MSDSGEGGRDGVACHAEVEYAVRGQAADELQVHGLLTAPDAVASFPGPAPDAPVVAERAAGHSAPPGNPLPGSPGRDCRRRPGPGRGLEDAGLPIGDADLGHRVYREADRGPVRHLHHADGKQMTRPARLPGVLPPDLADRDLGGEPQRSPPMLPVALSPLPQAPAPGRTEGCRARPGPEPSVQTGHSLILRAGLSAQLLPDRTVKLHVREPLTPSEPERGAIPAAVREPVATRTLPAPIRLAALTPAAGI